MTRASGRATKNAQRLHAARRVYFRKRGLVSVVVLVEALRSQPALWLGPSTGMSGDSLLVCIPQENRPRLEKIIKTLPILILPSEAVLERSFPLNCGLRHCRRIHHQPFPIVECFRKKTSHLLNHSISFSSSFCLNNYKKQIILLFSSSLQPVEQHRAQLVSCPPFPFEQTLRRVYRCVEPHLVLEITTPLIRLLYS